MYINTTSTKNETILAIPDMTSLDDHTGLDICYFTKKKVHSFFSDRALSMENFISNQKNVLVKYLYESVNLM